MNSPDSASIDELVQRAKHAERNLLRTLDVLTERRRRFRSVLTRVRGALTSGRAVLTLAALVLGTTSAVLGSVRSLRGMRRFHRPGTIRRTMPLVLLGASVGLLVFARRGRPSTRPAVRLG